MFKVHNIDAEMLSVEPSNFELMAFFVNAIILSANVLNEHKLVQDNQALIKQLLLNILKQDTAHATDEDNAYSATHSNNEKNGRGIAHTSNESCDRGATYLTSEKSNHAASAQTPAAAFPTSLPSKERS